jgi:uncharacterized protein DUF4349
MLRTVQIFANPVVAFAAATAIVLVACVLAAAHMQRQAYDIPLKGNGRFEETVERVAIAAPKLKLNVPHSENQAQAVSAATSSSSGSSSLAPLIARTAKISLYVTNVDKAAAAIASVATRNAGDVFSSDISKGDGSNAQPSGDMEIRIPAERFDVAMNALMQAGTVRERSSSAEDLTGDITDSGAKLRNLRRTEADIRAIMDRSGSVAQIMDAENQLSSVREQIETLESELKDMRERVAYATIDVDMQEQVKTTPVTPTTSSQIVSAWHDAVASLGAFTVSLIATLLWLAVFIPYGAAVVAIVWMLYLQIRARARARQLPS